MSSLPNVSILHVPFKYKVHKIQSLIHNQFNLKSQAYNLSSLTSNLLPSSPWQLPLPL